MAKKKRIQYTGDPIVSHIPDGSMCLVCEKLRDNCSNLQFKQMPPMKQCKIDGTTFVLCKQFKQEENK